MAATFKRFALYGVLFVTVLSTGAILVLHHLIELDKVKPQLEKAFQEFLQRDLTIDRLGWRFFPMPSLVGYDVKLWEDKDHLMAEGPEVVISISLTSLVQGKLKLEDLTFVNTQGTLRRTTDGKIPLVNMIQDIRARLRRIRKENGIQKPKYEFENIVIENGLVTLLDLKHQEEPYKTKLIVNAEGVIEGVPGKRLFPFSFKALARNSYGEGEIGITGILKKYPKVAISAPSFPIPVLRDFSKHVNNWEGLVSLDVVLERTLEGLDWKAKGKGTNVVPEKMAKGPNANFDFEVNPKSTSTLRGTIKGENTEAEYEFFLSQLGENHLNGTIQSQYLDVAEIIKWQKNLNPHMVKSTEAVQTERPAPFQWTANCQLSISTAVFRSIELTNIDITAFQDSTGNTKLHLVQSKGLGGTLTGDFALNKGTDTNRPAFMASWDLVEMKLAPILASVKSKQMASGVANSKGILRGNPAQMGWENTQGNISFEVREGYLWETPGLLKAFSRLNVKTLLKQVEGETGSGFAFDTARVNVKLQNGKALFEPAGLFESPSVRIGVMGEVDLFAKQVDGKIIFQFLTVVGDVLKAVPGVRQVLYGKNKGLIPIWLSIKGPWENPTVNPLPLKSISNSVKNGIGRLLGIPFRIFKSD